MNNLLTAITNKLSGSLLNDDVGGRVFLDEADDSTPYPYIVFFIITAPKERTFTEEYRNSLIQFSLYCAKSAGTAEMTNIYNHLSALFDECSLSMEESTLIWMRESNVTTMMDNDIVLPDGTKGVRHWAVDFEIKTSLN